MITTAGVADEMKAAIPQVTKIVEINQTNDSNHLLGRPNGYNAATVLIDSRGACAGAPGVDCGATIEQWGSDADAISRKNYIQRILTASPALGSEYDYLKGPMLLRVTGRLTPAQAGAYNQAFGGYGP